MAASNNKQHQAASCLHLFHQISISAAMVGGHSAHAVHWHSPVDQRMVVVQTYIGSTDYTITPWQVNTVLPLVIMSIFMYILSIWFYLYLLSIAYDIMIPNDSRTNLRSVRCLGSGHVAIPTALGRLSSALRRLPQPTSSTPSCSGFLSGHKTHQNSMGKVKSAENAWKWLNMYQYSGQQRTFRSNKKCVRHSHCSKLYHWDQWQNENSHAPTAHVS